MVIISILFFAFYRPPEQTCITKPMFESMKEMLLPLGYAFLMIMFIWIGITDIIYDDEESK
jgi:hypothetical protein